MTHLEIVKILRLMKPNRDAVDFVELTITKEVFVGVGPAKYVATGQAATLKNDSRVWIGDPDEISREVQQGSPHRLLAELDRRGQELWNAGWTFIDVQQGPDGKYEGMEEFLERLDASARPESPPPPVDDVLRVPSPLDFVNL